MDIHEEIALLELTLAPWREALGVDYTAYRNHVYRMAHFCLALHPCTAEQRDQIIIAACFHDLGIWSDQTIDYLPPSARRAREHLAAQQPDWIEPVRLMIEMHHKLRPYRGPHQALVEAFRKADLVDLSFGAIRFGLPRAQIGEVRRRFPNAGFHRRLMRLAREWFSQHPLKPPPFFKW